MASADTHIAYIYLMGVREGGPSKIGYANAPAKRLKQLEAHYKARGQFIMLGEWPVGARRAINVERYVHWLLRDRHFRGEWFNVSLDEVEVAVAKAIASPVQCMDEIPPLDIRGKEPSFPEHISLGYPAGTVSRIDSVRGPDETRAALIRQSVLAELERRERATPRKPTDP